MMRRAEWLYHKALTSWKGGRDMAARSILDRYDVIEEQETGTAFRKGRRLLDDAVHNRSCLFGRVHDCSHDGGLASNSSDRFARQSPPTSPVTSLDYR
jgi:hypothetical protein